LVHSEKNSTLVPMRLKTGDHANSFLPTHEQEQKNITGRKIQGKRKKKSIRGGVVSRGTKKGTKVFHYQVVKINRVVNH